MSNPMDEYRKLAGLKNLHEHKSWRLHEEPTFKVGDAVRVTEDAGTDSNKRGKVISIDGGWAQIRTDAKEMLWLPNMKLKTEAKGDRWSICPECEASFKVKPGDPLPPHRAFRGTGQCPGVGKAGE